jgi:nicotinamidase-related amidase
MRFQIPGDPRPWPRDPGTALSACALIVVDMQYDYCSPGFYIDRAGYDTARLSEPIPRIQRVLAAARRAGLRVIYTRHGRIAGSASTTAAPGEPGWEIVPELRPQPADAVIEKSTCSAFVSGELDSLLREKGIHYLALCGNTIDVCVHSTLRSAIDLGYECVLLADCCGAVNDELHAWSIASVKIEDGVFGTVASAADFAGSLERH